MDAAQRQLVLGVQRDERACAPPALKETFFKRQAELDGG